ncbi:MAG: GNAT family N-acetyltransferase [Acutalibacteraceae bacterium]
MVKHKKKILVFALSILSSGLLIGCSSITNNPTTNASEQTYSSQDYENSFQSLSEVLNISKDELENKLTLKNNDNTYRLVPATNTSENLNFYKDLVVYGDKEYTKLYFQNKKMKDERQAENYYNSYMNEMWKKSPPDLYFFLTFLNNEPAGIISTSSLTDSKEITIGYITDQSKANKKVATNSLKILVEFLKYLKSANVYNYEKLSLWIFDENISSIKVAQNNGFTLSDTNKDKQMSKYTLNLKN